MIDLDVSVLLDGEPIPIERIDGSRVTLEMAPVASEVWVTYNAYAGAWEKWQPPRNLGSRSRLAGRKGCRSKQIAKRRKANKQARQQRR